MSGRALSKARTAKLSYLVILPSFMLIILIWQLAIVPKTLREQTTPQTASPSSRKLPNIILFAADGVNADHLSMYGYGRNTTPHLARLAKKGFVVKNVASNSSETYSSLLSVLTGRLPTTLKVNYAPQILAGENSYLHLPGILKTLGYSTYQVSIRYYGDAADANLRRAFDKANGRDVHASSISQWLIHLEPAANLFLDNVWSRIVSKIRYLAGQGPAVTEFDQVNNTYQPDVRGWKYDKIRITDAINYIKNDQPPFFLHIHLMGTHCCGFSPKKRVFSAQHEKQNKGNRADFYDDAILESDAAFGYLVNRLARWNYLKNTIIVYFSDHPAHWDFKGRVPLIFIFPDLGYNGKGPDEGQLIDVAPTLLEKLKQSIPTWMEGQSLFEPGLVNHRPAYISSQPMKRHKVWNTKVLMHVWTIDEIGPPAYGLKTMAMKICNQWFNYDLKSSSLVTGNIPGYQGQCDEKAPSNSEIKEMIRRHLQERGYKV
ncbi:MAG: sulfatase-like hydrolase/transferase [Candidatus Omnitrophica bacterium]|nr:sulfatase-like hydrolase/transferase [Candidatus Omnitrophota bacterium]